jgi:hypothetical protein
MASGGDRPVGSSVPDDAPRSGSGQHRKCGCHRRVRAFRSAYVTWDVSWSVAVQQTDAYCTDLTTVRLPGAGEQWLERMLHAAGAQ